MASVDPAPDTDLDAALRDAESLLTSLKARHAQIQSALQERQQIQTHLQSQHRRELQADLRDYIQRLEELETLLESRLLTWGSFKQPFWQAVRFGGLGLVLGFLLRGCVAV